MPGKKSAPILVIVGIALVCSFALEVAAQGQGPEVFVVEGGTIIDGTGNGAQEVLTE